MTYADKLKTYIAQTRIKQKDLAVILGVNPVILNRWIKGKAEPRPIWKRYIDKKIKLDFS